MQGDGDTWHHGGVDVKPGENYEDLYPEDGLTVRQRTAFGA
jgi:hypothetical protein